jgi:nitroreductase
MTKIYHSIEKGLSFENTRLGFGKKQIHELMDLLDIYREYNFPEDNLVYLTAIDNLNKYVDYHEKRNYDISDTTKQISRYLKKRETNTGGTHEIEQSKISTDVKDFFGFSNSRHSVRTFSNKPVDIQLIKKAITMAQNSPSSCNRQPWITRIVNEASHKKKLINNQYGNRGFGETVDTFIIVTSDIQCYDSITERNACFVDGGIYSMNLLYCLHYYGLATCPLSASLTAIQEENIRHCFNIPESENLVLFIAVGNYVDNYKVPKSTRYAPTIIHY